MSTGNVLPLRRRATDRSPAPELVVWTSLWGRSLGYVLGDNEQRARFSRALQEAMAMRKMSARALAKAVNVDPRRIARFVAEKDLPNIYESQALAAALRVDEDLFRNPPEVPPPPPKPYYPIERYLLEAKRSGQVEGHRRASTPRVAPDGGRPAQSPPPRPRDSEAERE